MKHRDLFLALAMGEVSSLMLTEWQPHPSVVVCRAAYQRKRNIRAWRWLVFSVLVDISIIIAAILLRNHRFYEIFPFPLGPSGPAFVLSFLSSIYFAEIAANSVESKWGRSDLDFLEDAEKLSRYMADHMVDATALRDRKIFCDAVEGDLVSIASLVHRREHMGGMTGALEQPEAFRSLYELSRRFNLVKDGWRSYFDRAEAALKKEEGLPAM